MIKSLKSTDMQNMCSHSKIPGKVKLLEQAEI